VYECTGWSQAGSAVDLQRLQAVSPFAFLGGALASALWADWIRMEGGGC